ncbi:hypothetical protein C1645_874098 [Glomus cerebriforme]|uniref:Uncharacterized protein n=1 Tax=Glomus cerebriforme TaxID=658196 RepID=A0A397TAW0_9GLOM|nr:hypothetical protein C1645_874098 [Glomus cerebriforme]
MTSPYLPDDCIHDILKHLQNNRSTLFNCLLVNRFWCRATVPLLYANPFDNVMINENHYLIILTLILCFNKAEILQLKNQLKQLNQLKYNNNIDKIDIDIKDNYKPLFKYPKYLEKYDCFTVNCIIFEWFRNYLNLSYNHEIVKNFIPSFHQSNLRQCVNIRQFQISLHLFYNKTYNIQVLTSNLTHLNLLSLQDINDDVMAQEFLENVANICLNLRKFEITSILYNNFIKTNETICTIIQNQNNLKAFKIVQCTNLLDKVLVSLELQKHSLVYIEFEHVNFNNIPSKTFKYLCNLYNLKYLKFDNCEKFSSEQCKMLNFASFNLKELIIIHNGRNYNNTILSMIKYLAPSLQRLSLIIGSLTIPIIEYLSIYCPNLNTLEIETTSIFNELLFPYFKNLKVRILILRIINENFINLAINLPISVKEISINFYQSHDSPYFHYSLHNPHSLNFKEFLENCHNCLELINLNQFINLEFLSIILNYIEKSNNNSLKFLGMKKLEKVLNDDESKLLDQIKAKGVEIVDFYNIYKDNTNFDFII